MNRHLVWELTDPFKIQELLVQPLRNARLDAHPHSMIPLVWVRFWYEDSTFDTCSIYVPWGHFNVGNTYGIADLTSFKDECREFLRQSSDPEAARIFNDARLWRATK